MGRFHGQKFYAARADAAGGVTCPFTARPFSTLVELRRDPGDASLERLARGLLDHGCRAAMCRGEGAERCRDIFDRVIDERGCTTPDGFSPWSMAVDEAFEEALEYFTLPTGEADTGLVVVVGGDDDFRAAAGAFGRLAGRACEWLAEVEPETADRPCRAQPTLG